jgi:hypothetical protein
MRKLQDTGMTRKLGIRVSPCMMHQSSTGRSAAHLPRNDHGTISGIEIICRTWFAVLTYKSPIEAFDLRMVKLDARGLNSHRFK